MICEVAEVRTNESTNRSTDEICHECFIGRVYRELGCSFVGGRTVIIEASFLGRPCPVYQIVESQIYCSKLKRYVEWDYCSRCPIVVRPVIQETIKKLRSLLDRMEFKEAEQRLLEAVERLHAGPEHYSECISRAKASLESCLRTILTKLGKPIEDSADMPTLWKEVRKELAILDMPGDAATKQIAAGLYSVVVGISTMRNELSPDHGRVETSQPLQSQTELVLNCTATLCLFLALRFREISTGKKSRM